MGLVRRRGLGKEVRIFRKNSSPYRITKGEGTEKTIMKAVSINTAQMAIREENN